MSSRSRKRGRIKSDALVVGIDVAKRSHVAVCRGAGGQKEKPFCFRNDGMGYDKLLKRAEESRQRHGSASVVFALEATGHYGHALRYFLADRGYELMGINPAHTKRIKELEDNSPEKSDAKDAGLIADLAREGRGRPAMLPRGVFADLRRLSKFRERLVSERTRLFNRYHGLVDLLFPECRTYRAFVLAGLLNLKTPSPLADETILGSREFLARQAKRARDESRRRRVPADQLHADRIPLDRVLGSLTGKEERRRAGAHACTIHGYTMSEVADYLGVHYTTVSRWVRSAESDNS